MFFFLCFVVVHSIVVVVVVALCWSSAIIAARSPGEALGAAALPGGFEPQAAIANIVIAKEKLQIMRCGCVIICVNLCAIAL